MENKELAADEARKAAHLQSIRSRVESDVNSSIARRAEETSAPEALRMERVAGELRGNATPGCGARGSRSGMMSLRRRRPAGRKGARCASGSSPS
jgi:hypothetical protein